MKPKTSLLFTIVGGRRGSCITAGCLLVLLSMTLTLPPRRAEAASPQSAIPGDLLGTWRFEGPGISGYVTYHESGGSVENDNGIAGPSVGIGAWTRLGPREFRHVLHKQVWGIGRNGNGETVIQCNGLVKVSSRITLNADGSEYTAVDEVQVFDPAGNLVFNPPPAPSRGSRIVAESAPVAAQPVMLPPVISRGEVTVRFSGTPGANHRLLRAASPERDWQTLAEVVVPTNAVGIFTDIDPPRPSGFYRVGTPSAADQP